jgi:hypothetical protein
LRKLTSDDIDLDSDPEVMRFLKWQPPVPDFDLHEMVYAMTRAEWAAAR